LRSTLRDAGAAPDVIEHLFDIPDQQGADVFGDFGDLHGGDDIMIEQVGPMDIESGLNQPTWELPPELRQPGFRVATRPPHSRAEPGGLPAAQPRRTMTPSSGPSRSGCKPSGPGRRPGPVDSSSVPPAASVAASKLTGSLVMLSVTSSRSSSVARR
jgi:hypothetical protein